MCGCVIYIYEYNVLIKTHERVSTEYTSNIHANGKNSIIVLDGKLDKTITCLSQQDDRNRSSMSFVLNLKT